MNTKSKNYKKYRTVLEEWYGVRDLKRNQAWIELDQPIRHGWWVEYDVREDYKQRIDADVFEYINKLIHQRSWCANANRIERWGKRLYEVFPHRRMISESEYLKLPLSVRKYFRRSTLRPWIGASYYCILTFQFVIKMTPSYITHRQEHDELIAQRYAELHDKLWNEFRHYYYPKRRDKATRAILHRRDRSYNKQQLRKFSKQQDLEADINFRDKLGRIDWWWD